MSLTDLHTILRLPTGIFYSNGVKANVIFFDNHEASKDPWTKEVWYYDYRTNVHHTLKKEDHAFRRPDRLHQVLQPGESPQAQADLDADKNLEGRWRKFTYEELITRDKSSLDVFWLRDKSLFDLDNLPEPDQLAEEIIENIKAGLILFDISASSAATVCRSCVASAILFAFSMSKACRRRRSPSAAPLASQQRVVHRAV